jgi:hypothetical protein
VKPPSPGVETQVLATLCHLGFRRRDAVAAIGRIRGNEPELGFEQLLRKSLPLLVHAVS